MNKTIQQLKNISKEYLNSKEEFCIITNSLKKSFKLTKSQLQKVDFGIVESCDQPLQRYCNTLNSNEQLIKLSNRMRQLALKGNLIIIKKAKKHESKFYGYRISAFIQNPEGSFNEIENFIQGLYGYEHIHIIIEKIMLELPVRYVVEDDKELLECVDFWIKELGIFYEE